MELTTLTVSKLFGYFDHTIQFNQDEKITIITAPNGYGKSVILRMLNAIFSGDFHYIEKLIVKDISLEFSDKTELLFTKKSIEGEVEIKQIAKGKKVNSYAYSKKSAAAAEILSGVPWLTRAGQGEWLDLRLGGLLTNRKAIEKYSRDDLFSTDDQNIMSLPDWVQEYVECINVRLIEDQRLIQRDKIHKKREDPFQRVDNTESVSPINTIEQYANELQREIKNLTSEYSAIAQKLDSTFPNRLLSPLPNGKAAYTEDKLKKHLNKIENSRKRLVRYGLIEDESAEYTTEQISEENLKVLTLYVLDTQKKLKVYDNLVSQLDFFTSILNDKQLSHKQVRISRNEGFYFETENGISLNMVALSSGEQHEVVLLYELIFKTDNNSLVLIDEPEISLHIAWQEAFLEDLRKIQKIQPFTAIISTHSPQIIGEDWSLVVDLNGEETG
ncbi:MAG: AAA family ATPase [Pseudohongiellaceae bacterium]